MTEFWNQRFGQSEYVYGKQANVYFKQCLDQLTPGSLLLPAEGEGRNAVYAASQGWTVTAFDSSAEGQKKALSLAEELGVQIDYQLVGFDEFDWQGPAFECLALIYTHQPAEKRQLYHRQLVQFLKPGGRLIVEGFSKAQLGKSSGGPQRLDMLYSAEELQEDFAAFSNLEIEEVNTVLEEGNYHVGEASVIRCLGIK